MARQIHVLKDCLGKRISRTADILETFRDYYSSLYSSSGPDQSVVLTFLQSHFKDRHFSDEHVQMLDEPISSEEVLGAIRRLKNGKSPGNDSFPAKFYKRYAQCLVAPLTQTFNELLTSGLVPPSWSKASVIVLPKKDRNPLDVRSYRPISLLNCDYKLFTTVLTKRLNSIIASYIHTDQTGFIQKLDIMDNIYKTLGLIKYCQSNHIGPSLLLSLDLEKAFDQVETCYILTLLEHLGAGPSFLRAIQSKSNGVRDIEWQDLC